MKKPKEIAQSVRNSFGNSWWMVIGYLAVRAIGDHYGNIAKRQLMAEAIADEIESREWGFETDVYTEIMDDDDVLDDMVAFTDNQGTEWYKNADGDWVNLDV